MCLTSTIENPWLILGVTLYPFAPICFRNPTPAVDYESVVDFVWPQVNDTEHISYLDINGNFTVQEEPEAKRVKFWNWLYDNYAAKQEADATTNTTVVTE